MLQQQLVQLLIYQLISVYKFIRMVLQLNVKFVRLDIMYQQQMRMFVVKMVSFVLLQVVVHKVLYQIVSNMKLILIHVPNVIQIIHWWKFQVIKNIVIQLHLRIVWNLYLIPIQVVLIEIHTNVVNVLMDMRLKHLQLQKKIG